MDQAQRQFRSEPDAVAPQRQLFAGQHRNRTDRPHRFGERQRDAQPRAVRPDGSAPRRAFHRRPDDTDGQFDHRQFQPEFLAGRSRIPPRLRADAPGLGVRRRQRELRGVRCAVAIAWQIPQRPDDPVARRAELRPPGDALSRGVGRAGVVRLHRRLDQRCAGVGLWRERDVHARRNADAGRGARQQHRAVVERSGRHRCRLHAHRNQRLPGQSMAEAQGDGEL